MRDSLFPLDAAAIACDRQDVISEQHLSSIVYHRMISSQEELERGFCTERKEGNTTRGALRVMRACGLFLFFSFSTTTRKDHTMLHHRHRRTPNHRTIQNDPSQPLLGPTLADERKLMWLWQERLRTQARLSQVEQEMLVLEQAIADVQRELAALRERRWGILLSILLSCLFHRRPFPQEQDYLRQREWLVCQQRAAQSRWNSQSALRRALQTSLQRLDTEEAALRGTSGLASEEPDLILPPLALTSVEAEEDRL